MVNQEDEAEPGNWVNPAEGAKPGRTKQNRIKVSSETDLVTDSGSGTNVASDTSYRLDVSIGRMSLPLGLWQFSFT